MDKRIVEKVFNEYRNVLLFFVNSFLRDKDKSQDIVQEVFMRLYKEKNEIYNLKGWLFKVAKNLVIDDLRRNKRFVYLDEETEIEDENENLKRNRLKSILKREVENLPKIYKDFFILRDVEGYSYEEIARKFKVPLGTVKTRVFRARIYLREKLKNELRRI
ncbi:MAG: RNA polymerase sigma factor [candidate division WOR-3 bacterium]